MMYKWNTTNNKRSNDNNIIEPINHYACTIDRTLV